MDPGSRGLRQRELQSGYEWRGANREGWGLTSKRATVWVWACQDRSMGAGVWDPREQLSGCDQ